MLLVDVSRTHINVLLLVRICQPASTATARYPNHLESINGWRLSLIYFATDVLINKSLDRRLITVQSDRPTDTVARETTRTQGLICILLIPRAHLRTASTSVPSPTVRRLLEMTFEWERSQVHLVGVCLFDQSLYLRGALHTTASRVPYHVVLCGWVGVCDVG